MIYLNYPQRHGLWRYMVVKYRPYVTKPLSYGTSHTPLELAKGSTYIVISGENELQERKNVRVTARCTHVHTHI